MCRNSYKLYTELLTFDMPDLAESLVEKNADCHYNIINESKPALIPLLGALSYIDNSINILRCYRTRDSPMADHTRNSERDLVHRHPAGTSVISSYNDKINNFCPTF